MRYDENAIRSYEIQWKRNQKLWFIEEIRDMMKREIKKPRINFNLEAILDYNLMK